jgi:hypothetical protein
VTSGSRRLSRRGSLGADANATAVGLGALVLLCWVLVFAKTGSGLDVSAADYVARSRRLPSLLVTGDPLVDYRNWSMLPLVLGRVFAAGTTAAFATVQFVVMVVGSAVLVGWVARRSPAVALAATLALFATTVPAYAMAFMGSYDQVLLVALVGMAISDQRLAAALFGIVVGLTHGELGVIAATGLVALAAVGVGPSTRVRAWGLGGVVAGRLGLTVWLTIAGQPSDRFTYIREQGLDRMLDHFTATWPVILLTAAGGGWLIIAAALAEWRSRRIALVVVVILAANLAVTAITIDQSRVVMLTTLPLVVTLAVFVRPGRQRPWWAVAAPYAAAAVGLAMPLVISWVGDIWRFGDPFHRSW